MLGPDRFTKKNRACSPLAAETEAQQGAGGKHLGIVLRQTRDKREDSEPQDCDLESANAAVAIGEPSGEPSTDGRHEQRCRHEYSSLASRDAPSCDQSGDDEAEHLNVHRVQRPASNAGHERAPLSWLEIRDPCEPAFVFDCRRIRRLNSHPCSSRQDCTTYRAAYSLTT